MIENTIGSVEANALANLLRSAGIGIRPPLRGTDSEGSMGSSMGGRAPRNSSTSDQS